MCGIFGILDIYGKLDTERFQVPNDTNILKHRGPDDFGSYLDSSIYLAQRRLSIIDLETGKQPILNEDGSKCIIFNGEIFNFQEIRKDLERRGHRFSTNSDTETILHAYEEWGNDCVESLRGMFAFAIWDAKEKKLFVARDRLGIKPFFYAFLGDIFYFASEMKAILQYRDFPRDIDLDGLASYFTLSYIPAPLTIFKHIRKLLPGYSLEVKNGKIIQHQYWDVYFNPDYSRSENYFMEGFMELLEEAIKLRLISDVPLGAFLSGGIDSGTVVAMMSRHSSEPVHTFNIGFGGNIGGYLDERRFARQVSRRYGTIHIEHEVFPNFQDIMEDIVKSFDEPFADHSTLPSYYVSKVTRQYVTVALSGLGGDELFGGYERYLGFKISNFYDKLPWFFRESIIRQIIEKIPERKDGHYTVNHLKRFARSASLPEGVRYLNFLSMLGGNRNKNLLVDSKIHKDHFDYCEELFLHYFSAPNATEPMDRVFYSDIKTYLPEDILACTDRMSMRHSLEVRVPFLDHKLLEFCTTIPNKMKIKLFRKKHILKRAVLNLLPKEVITHRKQGFEGPMTRWLQDDLKPFVLDALSDKNLEKHGLFDKKKVKTILDEHLNRVEINDKLIWALVQFQIWYNVYIEGNFPIIS